MLKQVLLGIGDYLQQSNLVFGIAQKELARRLPHHRQLGKEKRPGFIFFQTSLRNLPKLNNTTLEYKIERHDAVRAGSHLDFRIKMPDGTIQDFVLTRRTEFPDRTNKIFNIVRTPHHSLKYFYTDKAEFKGPENGKPAEYGWGKMKTIARGIMDVHHCDKNKIEFTINEKEFQGRYCIRRGSNNQWFMLRMRQEDANKYWRERMEYRNTEKDRARAYNSADEYIAETKINGAHFYVIPGPKENIIISRRMGADGNAINRAANIPALKYMKFPEKYYGRRIHCEIVAKDNNPSTTAGLLNARPSLSRDNQVRMDVPLRAVAFDLEGPGTYLDRKRSLELVEKYAPRSTGTFIRRPIDKFWLARRAQNKVFSVVSDNKRVGKTPRDFAQSQKDQGEEGVVLKKINGKYYQDPHIKDKAIHDFDDLKIIGFQEGTGRLSESLGAILCERDGGGQVKVGSGFTDEQRALIWANKDRFRNQYVKIKGNWETTNKSGNSSIHGPRFVSIHTDSQVDLVNEEDLWRFARAASAPGEENKTKYKLIASRGWRRNR